MLASHVSDNDEFIAIEQGLKSVQGSQLAAKEGKAIQKVAAEADKLISDFGGASDKAGLSYTLRDKIGENIDALNVKSDKVYKLIDESVDPTTPVNMEKIFDQIGDEAIELGGEAGLEPIQKKMLDLSLEDVTYKRLDKERKKIGAALRKAKGPYKDEDEATLRRLYGLVTEVQEDTLKQLDPNLAKEWELGKSLVAQRKKLEEDSLVLLGKDKAGAIMPKFGAAVKQLQSGDFTKFDKAMKALPPEYRQEVMLSSLNDAFSGGGRNQSFNMPEFVKWYDGLKKNRAVNVRMQRYLPPGARKRLKDIYTVASSMQKARTKFVGTGRLKETTDKFDTDQGLLRTLFGDVARVSAAAAAGQAVGSPVAGFFIVNRILGRSNKSKRVSAADDFLASDDFKFAVDKLADRSIDRGLIRNRVERKLAKSQKWKRLEKFLTDEQKQAITRAGIVNFLFPEPIPGTEQEKEPVLEAETQ